MEVCQLASGGLSQNFSFQFTSDFPCVLNMEWTKDKVFSLIENFRERPVLWDRQRKDYKDRSKRRDALVEIGIIFDVDKEEIERKIKNLLCHWSRERKKERESKKSGAGSEGIYTSKWFANNSFEFLSDRNRSKGVINTEDLSKPTTSELDEALWNYEDETPEVSQTPTPKPLGSPKVKRRVFISTPKPSFSRYKPTAAKGQTISKRKNIHAGKYRDQYSLFGEQVGIQIRELPSPYARKVVKHVINTVLFDAEMGKYDAPQSTLTQPSSFLAQLYSQSPIFGVPMSTHVPATLHTQASLVQNHHNLPQSFSDTASLLDSRESATTDSDTMDTNC